MICLWNKIYLHLTLVWNFLIYLYSSLYKAPENKYNFIIYEIKKIYI